MRRSFFPLPSLAQADDETVTIADYAVRVEFVPKDATMEEVKAYFEEWGPVSATSTCQWHAQSFLFNKVGVSIYGHSQGKIE